MALESAKFVTGVDFAMDKVSFIGKLALLSSATSDDAQPTPGFMLPEICQITFLSGGQNQDLIDFLDDRLAKKSCYVKTKVLRIMKHLVRNGHPDFRQGLRKRSQRISEAIKYSGPPHLLHGNALYLQVRQEAKELSELLFTTSEDDFSQSSMSSSSKPQAFGMGSTGTGKLEGFGSTPVANDKSIGDSIIDGLRDLAQRVTDLSSDPRKDVTFAASSASLIPGYRPAAVPDAGSFSDANASTLPQVAHRKQQKRHVKGVAGGGWDDDGDDHDDEGVQRNALSLRYMGKDDSERLRSADGGSQSSASSGKADSSQSDVKSDNCSSERQLVDAFVFADDDKAIIPLRDDIQKFVLSCSNVNCEVTVELLCNGLKTSKVTHSMRSLLLLEALLRTDLVSPDFISIVCCRHLTTLFNSTTTDGRVRQKARKVIRILEKLAPNQRLLFSDVAVDGAASSANGRPKSEFFIQSGSATRDAVCTTTAGGKDENSGVSSVFPFLSQNT